MIGRGGLVECAKAPELERGAIVWFVGAGCWTEKFTIIGRSAFGGYDTVILDASALSRDGWFCSPFHVVEEHCRPISEQFGIGCYYDLSEPKATEEEIRAAIEAGHAYEERVKAEKEEEQEARDAMRAKYAGKYPEVSTRYGNTVQVAKNIRKDLAEAFPGCKFSVRKRYDDDLIISWTDGPTEEEVTAVSGKWVQNCERDKWNDDIWEHTDTAFTSVFGGVESIWCERDFSKEINDAMTAEISALCPGLPVDKSVYATDEHYQQVLKARNTYKEIDSCPSWVSCRILAELVLRGRSLYVKPEAKKPEAKPEQPGTDGAKGVQIIDYSEKAVAVVGETRAISDKLKELGGRFNARLSCGAGWIFSKKREEALRAALAL